MRLPAMGLQPRSIPCTGYGSEQLNGPMVHEWVGLSGEALLVGWAKLHPFKPHFGLRWSISGSRVKVPNLRCVYPNTVRVPRPPAFTLMLRGLTAEQGSWENRWKKVFGKPFHQLIDFVKINTLYRSIWTGKYHYLHSKINSTVVVYKYVLYIFETSH